MMDANWTFNSSTSMMDVDDAAIKKVSVKKGKRTSQQAQRGTPWTEEEHSCMKCRRFLYGLEGVARFSVQTKSNSQVASYAQRFFKRLNSANKGKRLSINDIRTVNPEKLPAFEKATTSCMPGICCNEKSTDAGNQLLPEHTTEASVDGEIQLLHESQLKLQLMPGSCQNAL